jgi:hypothetical protein
MSLKDIVFSKEFVMNLVRTLGPYGPAGNKVLQARIIPDGNTVPKKAVKMICQNERAFPF